MPDGKKCESEKKKEEREKGKKDETGIMDPGAVNSFPACRPGRCLFSGTKGQQPGQANVGRLRPLDQRDIAAAATTAACRIEPRARMARDRRMSGTAGTPRKSGVAIVLVPYTLYIHAPSAGRASCERCSQEEAGGACTHVWPVVVKGWIE